MLKKKKNGDFYFAIARVYEVIADLVGPQIQPVLELALQLVEISPDLRDRVVQGEVEEDLTHLPDRRRLDGNHRDPTGELQDLEGGRVPEDGSCQRQIGLLEDQLDER